MIIIFCPKKKKKTQSEIRFVMDAIITLMKIKWKSQIFMHLVLVYNNFKIYSVAPKQYLQSVVFTALDRFLSFRDWNFIIIIFSSTGLVNLKMPPMPVPYGATNQVIRCTTKEDLKIYPQWSIINSKGQYDITTGTVSTVYTSSRTNSIVNLSNVTELWNGMYECSIILLLVLLIIKDDTMMAKQKKCTFNTHVKAPPPPTTPLWTRNKQNEKNQNLLALTPLVFAS